MIGACNPLSLSVVSTFTDKSMLPFRFSLDRDERELPDSSVERHERFERRDPPDWRGRRLSLVAHLPSTEDVAPEQIHQQRQLSAWPRTRSPPRSMNLVPGFDRRTPRVEADDEINAVTPRFEPAVRVRTKPSLSAGVDQGNERPRNAKAGASFPCLPSEVS